MPKKHAFSYKVFYVSVPITADAPVAVSRFFSYNRWNVLSLHTKDHGARAVTISWHEFIVRELDAAQIPFESDYRVELITLPRLFGFAFNPISYWLVRDGSGLLRAAICEVNNTFRQNHNYLICKADHSPILPNDMLTAQKALYVSPFNPMEGYYQMSFTINETMFKSVINYHNAQGQLVLNTYLGGQFSPLTSRNILSVVFRYPLMTIAVVVRIRWQALRLIVKRVALTVKARPRQYENQKTTISKKQ